MTRVKNANTQYSTVQIDPGNMEISSLLFDDILDVLAVNARNAKASHRVNLSMDQKYKKKPECET